MYATLLIYQLQSNMFSQEHFKVKFHDIKFSLAGARILTHGLLPHNFLPGICISLKYHLVPIDWKPVL